MQEYQVTRGVAFEFDNGRRIDYDIHGRPAPKVGEIVRGFSPMNLVNPVTREVKPVFYKDLGSGYEDPTKPSVVILHPLNGLATPICEVGAKACQTLSGELPEGVFLYIVTTETPTQILRAARKQNLTVPVLSVRQSDFGPNWGIELREANKQRARPLLERSLFVSPGCKPEMGNADKVRYLFVGIEPNQGGPQPSFEEALEVAVAAKEA